MIQRNILKIFVCLKVSWEKNNGDARYFHLLKMSVKHLQTNIQNRLQLFCVTYTFFTLKSISFVVKVTYNFVTSAVKNEYLQSGPFCAVGWLSFFFSTLLRVIKEVWSNPWMVGLHQNVCGMNYYLRCWMITIAIIKSGCATHIYMSLDISVCSGCMMQVMIYITSICL